MLCSHSFLFSIRGHLLLFMIEPTLPIKSISAAITYRFLLSGLLFGVWCVCLALVLSLRAFESHCEHREYSWIWPCVIGILNSRVRTLSSMSDQTRYWEAPHSPSACVASRLVLNRGRQVCRYPINLRWFMVSQAFPQLFFIIIIIFFFCTHCNMWTAHRMEGFLLLFRPIRMCVFVHFSHFPLFFLWSYQMLTCLLPRASPGLCSALQAMHLGLSYWSNPGYSWEKDAFLLNIYLLCKYWAVWAFCS